MRCAISTSEWTAAAGAAAAVAIRRLCLRRTGVLKGIRGRAEGCYPDPLRGTAAAEFVLTKRPKVSPDRWADAHPFDALKMLRTGIGQDRCRHTTRLCRSAGYGREVRQS